MRRGGLAYDLRFTIPAIAAVCAFGAALAFSRMGLAGLVACTAPTGLVMLSMRRYLQDARASTDRARWENAELRRAHGQLAARNADLRDLLEFARGLDAYAHDRAELVGFAERFLSQATGGVARIRIGPGSGGTTLTVAGRQVGTLSVIEGDNGFDEARWMRLRDGVVPQLATAIEAAES
jgi:hypothetical protein